MIGALPVRTQARRVELQGAANFRDLGGYGAGSGRTAWGAIFRSDSLSALTRSDIGVLMDLGLRSVVDLRHESELSRAKCALEGMLADARSYPLVFHCTHGRDRTGLAASLVLLAAGVPSDDVIADFVLSNEYLRERLAGIDAVAAKELELQPSHLGAALNHLDERYGGVEPYIAGLGVSPGQLAAFRRQFVVRQRA
ncbi:MAG TPA: tyrosine-protein phosphatase [Chloroflexota bacterium]